MDNFPRNFRDNLRASRSALFYAAVIVAALIIGLMATRAGSPSTVTRSWPQLQAA